MPLHIVIIVLCDMIAYKFEIMSLVADVVFTYFDYLNYLRVDKFWILGECVGMLF